MSMIGSPTPESRIVAVAGVLSAEVDGEAVLLHGGTYFGLNAVAARVWFLLGEGKSLGSLCETLQSEFDVPAEVLWDDVVKLIGEMSTSGLVVDAA